MASIAMRCASTVARNNVSPRIASPRVIRPQQDLASDWDALRNDVPKSITTLEARVTELAKTKSLPDGVTSGALDSARGNLSDAKTFWEQATGNHAAGSMQDAVAAGEHAKEKADAAMVDLEQKHGLPAGAVGTVAAVGPAAATPVSIAHDSDHEKRA